MLSGIPTSINIRNYKIVEEGREHLVLQLTNKPCSTLGKECVRIIAVCKSPSTP